MAYSRWTIRLVRTMILLAFVGYFSLSAMDRPIYVSSIPDMQTFSQLARTVQTQQVIKFVIDVHSGKILYFDVNLYPLHYDFVTQVLYRKKKLDLAERQTFFQNYDAEKPQFILGYLTYHVTNHTFDFSFWENDRIRPADIIKVRRQLLDSLFIPDIAFRPESTRQEQLLPELTSIPTVTNDALYRQVEFQSFHDGKAIGRLVIVPSDTPFEALTFEPTDVVILQAIYPDLPPVAGILSATFSTPLAHVNLRARAWNIPNAGLKNAATLYAGLANQIVFLEVSAQKHLLRLATDLEIQEWKQLREQHRKVMLPPADLKIKELHSLAGMRATASIAYGTKAANLGELATRARLNDGIKVPPGFAIPFHFYADHMSRHGLISELESLLNDSRWLVDRVWRKQALETFRHRICTAELDPALLEAVSTRVMQSKWDGVFVRSSTNAEDLDGFNGAGLYDTVPNVKGRDALAAAILKVWASLWNAHAVDERELFGIDHRAVYAGALIQVGINATSAGVLVTKNLYDPDDNHSYTINAKRGLGLRVVAGTTIPEQVIYDVRYPGARVISRSDDRTMLTFDPAGGIREVDTAIGTPVLSDANSRRLALAVQSILPLFPSNRPLDVEWLFEGETLYLVQVRPFIR